MEKLRELIEKQREGKESSPVYMVGEQLLDIAGKEPTALELLRQDLENPEMSLEKAEAKIKAYSDKNRKGASSFCVSPRVAEGILRKFYGLPEPEEASAKKAAQPPVQSGYIDLDSFL